MDVTPRTRAKVVALKEHASLSVRKIARKLDLSKSTVGRIIKKRETTGDAGVSRRGKCGRKRKTTVRDDKMIVRNSVLNPRKNSRELQRDLIPADIHIDCPS